MQEWEQVSFWLTKLLELVNSEITALLTSRSWKPDILILLGLARNSRIRSESLAQTYLKTDLLNVKFLCSSFFNPSFYFLYLKSALLPVMTLLCPFVSRHSQRQVVTISAMIYWGLSVPYDVMAVYILRKSLPGKVNSFKKTNDYWKLLKNCLGNKEPRSE